MLLKNGFRCKIKNKKFVNFSKRWRWYTSDEIVSARPLTFQKLMIMHNRLQNAMYVCIILGFACIIAYVLAYINLL